jgi:UDP-GlcNAc:undecaprenyl-phosphate GlcNAc-1-phosphate transferase
MAILLLTLICSCALGLAFTPLAAALARRVGLLDRPDGQRKIHLRPIPLAGGLAIFASLCLALAAAIFLSPDAACWFEQSRLSLPGLFASGGILCLVGVIDDRISLRGRHKLAGQILAIAPLVASGVSVASIDLFGITVPLGLFALPATLFWLLGAINSLNLIDGMDGMVGCVGGGIALAIAGLCLLTEQFAAALIALALLGAIAGFLGFNLPPARVYLGDCGSMIIGMIIGVLALQSALKGPTTVMLTIPVALFTIPILDSAAAIARRTLTGRSIYAPDRGHLHHCLERRGLSRPRVLVLVCALCLLTGLGALASLALHRQLLAAVAAAAVFGILAITRLFGHSELMLLRKRLAAFCERLRYGRDQRRRFELCVHLQGSADWSPKWKRIAIAAEQLRLSSAYFDVNIPAIQERYHARLEQAGLTPDDARVWKFEFPLALHGRHYGRIEVLGVRDGTPVFEKIEIMTGIAEDVERFIGEMVAGPELTKPTRTAPSGMTTSSGARQFPAVKLA